MFNFNSLLNVTHFEKKKVERTRDKKDELFRHLERVAPRVLTWNPDLAFSGLAQGDWAAYRCSKLAGWAEQSIITHKSNSQKSSSLFELNKLQAG